ncbi:peptidase family M3-domain-containing protein [Sporodiniella umbellata]|nr:peptidase family M3-domain-containing protein [Sporodiniella umbellata]
MIRVSTGSILQHAITLPRVSRISKRLRHSFQLNTSSPIKSNDNHLRSIFDDQELWKDLSKATGINPVGLCGHSHFSSIPGIQFAAQQAIQRSQILVERICNASINGPSEMRKVIKNLDRLSDTLCSVIDLAEFLRNAHPDKAIQDSVHQAYSDLCSYMNTLNTDTRIHGILAQVLADKPLVSKLSTAEHKSALVLLHDFEKSGIHLPDKKRKEFVRLSDLVIHLGREFVQQNPHAIQKVKIPLSMISGISVPKTYINDGFAYIPTNSQYAHAILKYGENESVRKQMYQCINSATEESIEVLENLMKTRAQLATLVGNSSFAELQLLDKMAKNPENVETFLKTLLKHQEPVFRKDMLLLQNAKKKESADAMIHAWDRDYYMRKCNETTLRKQSATMPHFTVGSVIQGLSRLFDNLYGVKFEFSPMRPGESWNHEVRKLNVICENEGKIGTIYCDLFSRPGKTAHAAHYTIRTSRRVDDDDDQSDIHFAFPGRNVDEANFLPPIDQGGESVRGKDGLYQLPIIALTCDFAQGDHAALLSMQEIETLFHEMGHAMHSMLGRTDFHNVAGTRCASDFVELPSVLMEHFASHPQVVSLFTNKPVPQSAFGHEKSFEGIELNAQILMALVDQSYHSSRANSNDFSSVKEWNKLQDSVGLFPSVPKTMWPVQFNHLFGYASNYYSYLLDRTLARKVWESFKENPLDREKGQAFRDGVLKWGGSRDPWECISSVLSEKDASKIVYGDQEAMKTVGDWGLDVNKNKN